MIGFAGGRIQAVPANLILVKNISVIGIVWGAQAERATTYGEGGTRCVTLADFSSCSQAVIAGVQPLLRCTSLLSVFREQLE
jgi:hypothetical protein